jgi:hypothetical protein
MNGWIVLALILGSFVIGFAGLIVPGYIQSEMNKVWESTGYGQAGGRAGDSSRRRSPPRGPAAHRAPRAGLATQYVAGDQVPGAAQLLLERAGGRVVAVGLEHARVGARLGQALRRCGVELEHDAALVDLATSGASTKRWPPGRTLVSITKPSKMSSSGTASTCSTLPSSLPSLE